jgi:uncharacterized membrane protein
MDRLLYMDAEIIPNRSLSQRGFVILISLVTFFNVLAAGVFLYLGAHLVPLFLGLDVVAIAVAFLVSYAAARRIERVQVSSTEIRITHETPKWTQLVWSSPTAFTRIALEVEDEIPVALRLRLSGREVAVAQALSPRERAEFARALETAVWRARRERL